MRTNSQRLNKYSAKLSGVVARDRMEKYGTNQKSSFEASSAKMTEVEKKVKAILNKSGTPPLLNHHYMNYAKKLLRQDMTEATISQGIQYKRGLNSAILYLIGKIITTRKISLTQDDMLLYLHFDNDSLDYSGYGNDAVSLDPHFTGGVIEEGVDTAAAGTNIHEDEYWNEHDRRARKTGAAYDCTSLKVTDRLVGKNAGGQLHRSAGNAENIILPNYVEVSKIEAMFNIKTPSPNATNRYMLKRMTHKTEEYTNGLGCPALYADIGTGYLYRRVSGWNIAGWTDYYDLGATAVADFLTHTDWFGVGVMSFNEANTYTVNLDNFLWDLFCYIRITYRDRNRAFVVPHSAVFNVTERISVAAWVKPQDTTGFEGIVDKGWAYTTGAWGLQRTGRQVTWALATPMSFVTATAVNILNLNEWNFVLGTYEKATGKLRLYVNGTLAAETTYIMTIQTNAYDIYVGDAHMTGVAFEGMIDEVRIWNRALEAQEILQMYNIEKNLMGI